MVGVSVTFMVFIIMRCYMKGLANISCRDESGQSVDWFIIYKLPGKSTGNLRGLQYLYMDSSTKGWTFGKYLINDSRSAVAQTLQPLFKYCKYESEDLGFLLYNDQPPKSGNNIAPGEMEALSSGSSYGHSKGVILLDRKTGIWLVHSTPRFPAKKKQYSWPSNAVRNGQSFICVSYPYAQFQDIGVQLQYIHPYSYDFALPQTYPQSLKCVAYRKCYPTRLPWQRQLSMMSVAKNKFISFAKYSRLGDDLYSGWLVHALADDLLVEGWVRGNGLPSNCSMKYHVYNVKAIQPYKNIKFKTTLDHSKWCVTDGQQKWTCVGDLNRDEAEMRRGGGAVCTEDPDVWKMFHSSVKDEEPCP